MAAQISIGDYEWNVAQSNSITIGVDVSGGETIDGFGLAFSVGDGGPNGPNVGGSETILIDSVGTGAGTIWSGKTLNVATAYPFPSGAANFVNATLPVLTDPVLASGTLMTFTLTAPSGGLAGRVGERLPLDPNLENQSSLTHGLEPPAVTFSVGHLTLVPEPSMAMMLLGLGGVGVLWGWRKRSGVRSRA